MSFLVFVDTSYPLLSLSCLLLSACRNYYFPLSWELVFCFLVTPQVSSTHCWQYVPHEIRCYIGSLVWRGSRILTWISKARKLVCFRCNAVDPFSFHNNHLQTPSENVAQRRMGSVMIGMRTTRACVNPSWLVVVTGKERGTFLLGKMGRINGFRQGLPTIEQ